MFTSLSIRQQTRHMAKHNVVEKNCTCCGSIYCHLFLGMVMHDNGFKQKKKLNQR